MTLGAAVLTAAVAGVGIGISLTVQGWEYGNARPQFVLGLVLFACGWLSGLAYLTTMRLQALVQAYRAGYRAGRQDSINLLQEAQIYAVQE